jgi:hypothetical protein
MDPPKFSSALAPDPPPPGTSIDPTSDLPPLPPESSSTPTPSPPPPTDNFYSPVNFNFYFHNPYDSLDRYSNKIRLLKITKDDSGRLQCRFTDGISLTEADNTYTAISYCAGDPKKIRTVQVDGKPFNAFTNLAHAIEETCRYRTKQYGDVEAILWTDQICINQSISRERSHQVGFMNKIYGSAREVAVCLSREELRGRSAIDWIEEMYEYVPQNHVYLDASRKFAYGRDFPDGERQRFKLYFESKMTVESFLDGWIDVISLTTQPWWSRAWVSNGRLICMLYRKRGLISS